MRAALNRSASSAKRLAYASEMSLVSPVLFGRPPLLSLNNIEIDDGAIAFDDQPRGKRVSVTQLAIGIPFLSSLPYDAEIHVTPRFEGALDARASGSPATRRRRSPIHVKRRSS